MKNWTTLQQVECFHLTFLRLLEEIVDKRCYVLKGGCNLRFFFGSPRYSEDIDLDVETVSVATLGKNVEKILTGKSFAHQLQAQDLKIERFSAPKQTTTTQRWKISLRPTTSDISIHTKIEFSRRGLDSGSELGAIDRAIAQTYQIPILLVKHYNARAAMYQKINALLNRTQTQARDVFDLDILMSHAQDKPLNPDDLNLRAMVEEKILSISFDEFRAQVVSYLSLPQQVQYADPVTWKNIQRRVIQSL